MGSYLTRKVWPVVPSIIGAFLTWAATANLDTLPPWAKTVIPLIVAILSALSTMYGLPGTDKVPGVWSADSVDKLKESQNNNL
jgi:hypothetical protein